MEEKESQLSHSEFLERERGERGERERDRLGSSLEWLQGISYLEREQRGGGGGEREREGLVCSIYVM